MGYSRQREILLSVLRSTRSHPTANEIYESMRERDPKISLGTVYRNLAMLSENGTILRIDTEHDSVHYDGCTHPHYHFVCNECGAVSDLFVERIDIDEKVENELGCSLSSHTLVFYGKCKNCKNVK